MLQVQYISQYTEKMDNKRKKVFFTTTAIKLHFIF